MIIEDKKFLWTHPLKMGGTSFRTVLVALFGDGNNYHASAVGGKITVNDGHRSLKSLLSIDPKYKNFYKVSLCRNPWDRVVSFWYHNKRHMALNRGETSLEMVNSKYRGFAPRHLNQIFWQNCTFEEYLRSKFLNDLCPKQYYFFEDIEVDEYIRYEHFELDIANVLKKIGVNADEYNLERFGHDTARKWGVDDYRVYYNDDQVEFIGEKFKYEIEKFNYSFDNGCRKNSETYNNELKSRIRQNKQKIKKLQEQITVLEAKLNKEYKAI